MENQKVAKNHDSENQKIAKNHDSENLKNILILSVGFMLLMAAWLTTAAVEQILLQSVQVEDPSFTGDGYLSIAIINGVFSLANFIAPTVVSIVGVRTSLVIGTWFYVAFITSFFYPNSTLLYGTSGLIGFGAANVWIANGIYFTRSSTKETIQKYVGIYWTIMSMGQLLGNAFVFWKFQGMNHIDHETRFIVTASMAVVCVLASITFMFLGKPPAHEKMKEKERTSGLVEKRPNNRYKSALVSITLPFRLVTNKHMLLLIPAAMYNGVEIAFFTTIYPTSVAFSEAFGGDTRKLVGCAGILTGVGALFGGIVFGILVDKFIKSKRSFIIYSSCLVHCLSFLLMYINLDDQAPLGPTLNTSWINPPSVPIAMFCAFLLGVGDGCISPQMCAAVGVIWPDDPSAALAIYRFFQAATCSAAYYVGTLTGLYNQILIFLAVTLLGTLSFQINETLITKMDKDKYTVETPAPAVMEQVNGLEQRKISIGITMKSDEKMRK